MSHPLLVVPVRELDQPADDQKWLIHHLWGRSAVGLLAGAPKLGKTFLGLDIALSVASNTPCLGHFPVEDPGRVLIYMAEDAPCVVRARLEALCRHRHLDIDCLDLHAITTPFLRLDQKEDQERLRQTVAWVKPRLLLLDPLIRLHAAEENSASEMSRLLGYFRDLQRAFGLALILVHHASKKTHRQPGKTLRGSGDLHAFGDSNAYLRRDKDQLTLILEHRAAPSPEPLALELVSGPDDETTHLEVRPRAPDPPPESDSLREQLLNLLRSAKQPMTRTALRAELRIKNERLGELLTHLERAALISRSAQGWRLSRP